jgi:hypothetical protein
MSNLNKIEMDIRSVLEKIANKAKISGWPKDKGNRSGHLCCQQMDG